MRRKSITHRSRHRPSSAAGSEKNKNSSMSASTGSKQDTRQKHGPMTNEYSDFKHDDTKHHDKSNVQGSTSTSSVLHRHDASTLVIDKPGNTQSQGSDQKRESDKDDLEAKFLKWLKPHDTEDPLDPVAPTTGLQRQMATRIMQQWVHARNSVKAYDDLPALFRQIVSSLPPIVFQDASKGWRWERRRMVDARIGRPFHHDAVSGKSVSQYPANTRDGGHKYEVLFSATLISEYLSPLAIFHNWQTLKNQTYEKNVKWLEKSPQDWWLPIAEDPPLTFRLQTHPVMVGSKMCNTTLFGIDPAGEVHGVFLVRGIKVMPPTRHLVPNLIIGKAESKGGITHRTSLRSQPEHNHYHSTATADATISGVNLRTPQSSHQIIFQIAQLAKIPIPAAALSLAFGVPLSGHYLACQAICGEHWYPEFDHILGRLYDTVPFAATKYNALQWIATEHEAAKRKVGQTAFGHASATAMADTSQPIQRTTGNALAVASTPTTLSSTPAPVPSSSSVVSTMDETKDEELTSAEAVTSRSSSQQQQPQPQQQHTGSPSASSSSSSSIAFQRCQDQRLERMLLYQAQREQMWKEQQRQKRHEGLTRPYVRHGDEDDDDIDNDEDEEDDSREEAGHIESEEEVDRRSLDTKDHPDEDRDDKHTKTSRSCGVDSKRTSRKKRNSKKGSNKNIGKNGIPNVTPHGKEAPISRGLRGAQRLMPYQDPWASIPKGKLEYPLGVQVQVDHDFRNYYTRPASTFTSVTATTATTATTSEAAEIKMRRFVRKCLYSQDQLDRAHADDALEEIMQSHRSPSSTTDLTRTTRTVPSLESPTQTWKRYTWQHKLPELSAIKKLETVTNASGVHANSRQPVTEESKVRFTEYTINNSVFPHEGQYTCANTSKHIHAALHSWRLMMMVTKRDTPDNRDGQDKIRYKLPRDRIANQLRQMTVAIHKHAKRSISRNNQLRNTKHVQTFGETGGTSVLGGSNGMGSVSTVAARGPGGKKPSNPFNSPSWNQTKDMRYNNVFMYYAKRQPAQSVINTCWSQGHWRADRKRRAEPGVIMNVQAQGSMGLDAALTLLSATVGPRSKSHGARAASEDQTGFIDPPHTPEGPECGKKVHAAHSQVGLGCPGLAVCQRMYEVCAESMMILPVDRFWDYMYTIAYDEERHALYQTYRNDTKVATPPRGKPSTTIYSTIGRGPHHQLHHQSTAAHSPLDPKQGFLDVHAYFRCFTTIRHNGTLFGWIRREWVGDYIAVFRAMRRAHAFLDDFVNIRFRESQNMIEIVTDPGRLGKLCIPIERLEDLKRAAIENMTIGEMIQYGFLEWLDAAEIGDRQHTLVVSTEEDIKIQRRAGKRPTHMMWHPMEDFDTISGQMIMANSISPPRMTYHDSMIKTAKKGCDNPIVDTGKVFSRTLVSQSPLVATLATKTMPRTEQCFGFHCRLVVMQYHQLNVHDPYAINARLGGLGYGSHIYQTIAKFFSKKVVNTNTASREQIGRPSVRDTRPFSDTNVMGMQPNGLVPVGRMVVNGDPLIGITTGVPASKNTHQRGSKATRRRDCNIIHRRETALVIRSEMRVNAEGQSSASVTTQSVRRFQIGDKISSREGQKGVISIMLRNSDMPYEVNEGWTPDLIASPEAFPTRSTPNQTFEIWTSSAYVLEPDELDPMLNAYEQRTAQRSQVVRILLKHNKDPLGRVNMRNPVNGQIIEGHVFGGFIYIEVLPHIAADKAHVRSEEGPTQLVTGQPVDGGQHGGGLRLGPMERVAMEVHGLSHTLKTRLHLCSDPAWLPCCARCGIKSELMWEAETALCRNCGSGKDICVTHTTRGGGVLFDDQTIPFGVMSHLILAPTGRSVTADGRKQFARHLM